MHLSTRPRTDLLENARAQMTVVPSTTSRETGGRSPNCCGFPQASFQAPIAPEVRAHSRELQWT